MSYQTNQTVLRINPPRILRTVNFDECSSCVAFKNQKDSAWNSIEFQFPLLNFYAGCLPKIFPCLSASNLFTKKSFLQAVQQTESLKAVEWMKVIFYIFKKVFMHREIWLISVGGSTGRLVTIEIRGLQLCIYDQWTFLKWLQHCGQVHVSEQRDCGFESQRVQAINTVFFLSAVVCP